MKRLKGPDRAPTTNGEAQVFVLPPDLLEKLGIQLSSFTHPTENLAANSIVCQSMKDDVKDLPVSVDGSSILETANLMKQSVFMSPTFISTATAETPSEQNISHILTETQESSSDGNELLISNNDANTGNTDRIEFVNSNINPTYMLQSENFEKIQAISEYEVENYSGDLILTNNIALSNLNKAVDDHADEAYASDGSNGHSGTSPETKNNLKETSEQQKPSNKIKILSEQIINHSDLNTIKKLQTKNSSSCFLIPVNTIVTGKTTKNHSNNHSKQKTVQDNTPDHIKIGDEIGKVDSINNMETVINKDTLVKDLFSDTYPGSIVTEDIREEIGHKVIDGYNMMEITDGFSKNKGEIILKIDKQPLTNNEDSKIKKITELGKDEKLIVRTMSDNTKKNVSNSENSSSESKLLIQGVEKPGGKHGNKIDTVLKTYQRTNIKKHIPELPHVNYTNIVDSNTLPEDVVIELDDINIGGYKNANEFCICSDFGQLMNYGSDNVYEHLHFNHKNSVGCNLETLFSIYNDTTILRELNVTEDIDVVDDVIETNQYNICWLSFICEDNDDAVELAIHESKMDALNSTPGQPRRSNRKRKSTATDQVGNVEPKSEKTIKCGACGVVLSEVEWNKHKDSEHNLIAWKDGQTIDLKNKGLLKKLGLKLKKLGVLRCTICNTNIKYLTKFVQHVEKCIKQKVENTSNLIDIYRVTKDALNKKDVTSKLLQRTRRSSRDLNLMIDLSELSINNAAKPVFNLDKQIQKSNCLETQSSAIPITENPAISTRRTFAKFVERDGYTYKSTRTKSIDLVSLTPTIMSTDSEVSPKSNKISVGVVSITKPIVKTSDIEEPSSATRQLKLDVASKSTGVVTTKSTKKSVNISSKVIEIKANSREKDTNNPKSMEISTIDVVSKPSEIKETLKIEIKDTSKSKNTPKTKGKAIRKSTRSSIEVPSEVKEIKETQKTEVETLKLKNTSKTEVKETLKSKDIPKAKDAQKSMRRSIDVSSKFTEIKDTAKAGVTETLKSMNTQKSECKGSSVSTRRSIDISSKAINIKDTSTAEVKATSKFTRTLNNKVLSRPTEAKIQEGTSISTRKLNNIDVSTKVNMAIEGEAPSNTTRKMIDVTGHQKPIQMSKLQASPSSKSNDDGTISKAKTDSIDFLKKAIDARLSEKESEECIDIEAPQKLLSKYKDEKVISEIFISQKQNKNLETLPTTTLKNIDIFSLSPVSSRKTRNIDSQLKLTKKFRDDAAFSKSANVDKSQTTPKTSRSSIDVTTKQTSKGTEVEVPNNNLKRKPVNAVASAKNTNKTIDAEQKCKHVDTSSTSAAVKTCAKINKKIIDAHVALNTTKKYTRIRAPKENTGSLISIPTKGTKNIDTPPKSETKSPDAPPKSKRFSTAIEATKSQVVPTEKDFNAQSKSEIEGIEVKVSFRSPKESVSMEIVTPTQSAKTATTQSAKTATTQSAKTATADNDNVTNSNSQVVTVDASSSSNSGNSAAHSSSNNNSVPNSEDNNPQPVEEIFAVAIKEEILSKCGVCKQAVDDSQWLEHIGKEHDYLAWREDEPPLDLQDDEVIRAHLYAIVKANGGLKCSKCGVVRKYVKPYLTHLSNCNGIKNEQYQVDISTASADMDTTWDLDDLPLASVSQGADGNIRPKRNVASKSQINASSTSVDGMDATQDFVDVPQRSYSRVVVRNALSQHRAVVCGVCSETVTENKWIDHIRMEHKYLAWKSGEPPLNLDDETEVKIFLQNVSKYNGGLICSKCGVVRLYVKKWMDHEATCKGDANGESSTSLLDSTGNTLNETNVSTNLVEIEVLPESIKCGKCSKEMPSKGWIDHIETEHNYLAWIEGQPRLEEDNPEAVSAYLHAMVKKRGALYCAKCGVTRKYPKAFLTHVSACEISGFKREDFYVEVSGAVKPGEYECAVCHEQGPLKDWKKHAMEKHYNVAWMAGEIPINLKNPYAVEKYIKEYRTKHNLVCKVCGAFRASCYGFYAHILTCGKAEDELEHLMNMCDICNNKYLCIYRNQHMAMHREQQIKKEMKERKAIKAEEEKNMEKANLQEGEPMGKRRAAEKAKKVMEKYTSNTQDGNHICLSCHIGFDNATLLKDHTCASQEEEASDSDISVKLEEQEESEDDMENVDSSISDEEADPLKRKRSAEPIPKIALPFKVRDFNYYLAKSFDNFCVLHYTSESLFNNWRSYEYDILSEEEATRYLPSLSESCKLRIGEEWQTYKRFEAQKRRDITLFTGATVRCMQWVPQNIDDEKEDFYLAVACFQNADCPRYGKEELPQHPGMLQIWRIGRFVSTPKFELGLAHDYGTIWAMDWCPSGARDIVPNSEGGPFRLGLLAVACSNGCAYILSVPRYHTELEVEPTICKLKPVAELRLSINSQHPPFRVGYQATSISWSPQKDHEVVMVGYSDGTTALYNLNTASPFLKAIENGVYIFYPFHDALTENSPITGVALSASEDLRHIVSGFASSSVTGATMSGWPGAGPVVRSHLAASSILYTPNWPAALLCSDDVLTMKSTNEMEWWGGGRRLGGACAAGGCARCGRVCLAAPPFVRVLRAHPCYPELKKQIVATMKMMPIAQKRKLKLVNDDLGMIVEPLTYEDTIKKYGIEFKTLSKKVRNVASKLSVDAEQRPERFPLCDMPAAAFCPSNDHHNRLAIASHAGFIFIITA